LRIFLGAFGQPGHAFPMLALGSRLVERGHKVMYETWERWRGAVVVAGMEFAPAPEYPVFPSASEPALKPYEAVLRATPVTHSQLVAFEPDVVVHDILTLAPALAAELEGVPVATLVPHLYPVSGPGFPPYSVGARMPRTAAGRAFWSMFERPLEYGLRIGRDELNATRVALGLPPVERLHGGLSPSLCLVATLPQLEYARDWPSSVHVVGPLLWEPPSPAVPLADDGRPLVLIAPSTAHDRHHRMLRAGLSGLSGLDVRVLGVINRRPPEVPIRSGLNARLVNWLSYADLMPRADLVVCHAGHGTLVRALMSGTPVVAVPHSGDMAENAARVAWSGAGLRLPWRLLSPRTLRWAVSYALAERSSLAGRAAEMAVWSAAHDGPARAAELVETLA
jgi:MGT family glycosyltransferase